MLRRHCRVLCAAAVERAVEEYDAVVVGGGPSGLSAAIRLKQLGGEDFRVALVEKGAAVGSHILSGQCIEPRSLDELIPNWKEKGAPLNQPVTRDAFYYLTEKSQFQSPILPSNLHNEKNYIASLGALCNWLGEQAEELGVDVFCGFAAAETVHGADNNSVEGVRLNDVGIDKKGQKTANYQPGMILKAKQIIFAEGSRGSCTKQLENKFKLRSGGRYQTYGLGVKEVWEIDPSKFSAGSILHTIGWPLTAAEGHCNTYGGSFMCHYGKNMVSLGFVVGLDYQNPYIRPYMELQKWKTHPFIRQVLENGKPVAYGARTLVEGGFVSRPNELAVPGAVLVGDCAGFLNLPKIKGTHTCMKSGTLAAEAIYEQVFASGKDKDGAKYGQKCTLYEKKFKSSWVYDELYMFRNVRQIFAMNFHAGVAYTGLTAMITKGKEPFTLPHKHPDHACLKKASACKPIKYPKPDHKITFDLLTNLSLSGVKHNSDQPSHLKIIDYNLAQEVNLKEYDGPESRYCPAGVFEFLDRGGVKRLVVSRENCLHCKACDIKDPKQNINWTVPEGGGGPEYDSAM